MVMNSSPAPDLVKEPVKKPVKEPVKEPVPGCTDPNANNTTTEADEDDGSCMYDRKAVMKFISNDYTDTPGCYFSDFAGFISQYECSPEIEQFELDVTTDSAGAITDVKTCLYPYSFQNRSYPMYTSTANTTPGGDECSKYKSGGENSPDTIDDLPVYAHGDVNKTVGLTTNYLNSDDDRVPVKLHLIPQ